MTKPQTNSHAATRTTSFAKTTKPAHASFQTAPNLKTAFSQAQNTARGSNMVKQDKPKPVQRPSPALALGSDALAFNAKWETERKTALADQSRAARKAAFLKKRVCGHKPARSKDR